MSVQNQTIVLHPSIDYRPFLKKAGKGATMIDVHISKDVVLGLTICTTPQYRTENGMFVKIASDEAKDYLVLMHDFKGNLIREVLIRAELMNYHLVRLLPNDEIVLVCSRCFYHNPELVDQNAQVFNFEGHRVREFVLGDGIADIQVDRKGLLWVSYFDEGIFGNYGWTFPLGADGLLCFDGQGKKVWHFEPTADLEAICDCYAMCLDAQDRVWFYYYTEFPLVCLDQDKNLKWWDCPIEGSSTIVISDDLLLMANGYDEDHFSLFRITTSGLQLLKNIELVAVLKGTFSKRDFINGNGVLFGCFDLDQLYLASLKGMA